MLTGLKHLHLSIPLRLWPGCLATLPCALTHLYMSLPRHEAGDGDLALPCLPSLAELDLVGPHVSQPGCDWAVQGATLAALRSVRLRGGGRCAGPDWLLQATALTRLDIAGSKLEQPLAPAAGVLPALRELRAPCEIVRGAWLSGLSALTKLEMCVSFGFVERHEGRAAVERVLDARAHQ
jgi:hypothetical protein